MPLDVEKLSVESLQVGELGDRLVEVHESILDLSIDLSADMVSQLTFRISDPYLKLHNNNYFMIGRTVTYGEYKFEIAAVDLKFGGRRPLKSYGGKKVTKTLVVFLRLFLQHRLLHELGFRFSVRTHLPMGRLNGYKKITGTSQLLIC